MKKFVFALFIFLFSFSVFSQTENKKESLILGVVGIEKSSYKAIKNYLTTTKGIFFEGYCSSDDIFLIKYESRIIKGEKEIIEKIKTLKPELKLFVKEGNIDEMKVNCQNNNTDFDK